MLLVLDNFERLLDASGDVADVLEASPGSRIVVTSRAPLRIAGEQEYPRAEPGRRTVPRLFAERARSVRPGWERRCRRAPSSTRSARSSIDSVGRRARRGARRAPLRCRRYAIASRAQLPLPGSGPRNVPDRQRSWRGPSPGATICSRPTCNASCMTSRSSTSASSTSKQRQVVEPPADGGDVLDHLATLVDQSLIRRDASENGHPVRDARDHPSLRPRASSGGRSRGRQSGAGTRSPTSPWPKPLRRTCPDSSLAAVARPADHRLSRTCGLRSAGGIDAGEVELALRFVRRDVAFLATGWTARRRHRPCGGGPFAMPGADQGDARSIGRRSGPPPGGSDTGTDVGTTRPGTTRSSSTLARAAGGCRGQRPNTAG